MKLNKKMIIILCSVIAAILVLIVIIMLLLGGRSKKLSYNKIEEKIVTAGMNYYKNHQDQLPEVGTVSIDTSTLVAQGYLSDLTTYTGEDEICNGTLYVTKNPSNYSYRAKLYCGTNYVTKTFKERVVTDVVTSGSGLYAEEQVNPNADDASMHKVYVFKGYNVNNYIKVGSYYWRIVKIYENGEMAVLGDPELLRTIWDNRYNIEEDKYTGINSYAVSRLSDTINTKVVGDVDGFLKIKSLITPHTACIGNRDTNDASKDGSSECSETLENQYFSLLPAYDYLNASLDSNCIAALDESCYNYNYLASERDEWWTITGVGDNTYEVYFVDGVMEADNASYTKSVRLYAHLDANVTYVSGTGTYADPYILK